MFDSLHLSSSVLVMTVSLRSTDMENVKQAQVEQDESVVSLQQEIEQIKFLLNEQQSPVSNSMPLIEAQPPVDLLKTDWKKYYSSK